jgi:ATP adenylyltransferase
MTQNNFGNQIGVQGGTSTRFAAALQRSGQRCELFDVPLIDQERYVVLPTLGSIIPKWLLIVPRYECINIAKWQATTFSSIQDIIGEVQEKLSFCSERVIWFEHGCSTSETQLGCGVDRAHLHLIIDAPFGIDDLFALARERFDETWKKSSVINDCYDQINWDSAYLTMGNHEQSFCTQENVERVGSQFFRKLVAELCMAQDCWNYKQHPFMGNVLETVKAFSIPTSL